MPPAVPTRILLVSSSAQLTEATEASVRRLGHELVSEPSMRAAGDRVLERPVELVIVDLDLGLGEPATRDVLLHLRATAAARKIFLLGMTRLRDDESMRVVFDWGLTNFIAVGKQDAPDAIELTATIDKILRGDIFGLEQYLDHISEERSLTVCSKKEREHIADQLEEFARGLGCHRQLAKSIATASEELVANAVEYAPGSLEAVTVRYATDGARLGVSVTDPFGRLRPERVVEYLRRCFKKGPDQMDDKAEGAGIGIYYVFRLVQNMVFNIDPGRRTEAIVLLQITPSYREFFTRPRSFNLFVGSGDRTQRG